MKTKILIVLAGLVLSPSVFAQVFANPSFQDLGTVSAGQSRMTVVSFMNQSSKPMQGVSANCSGSYTSFNCSSSCFSLPAYGSCSVYVTFHPSANDGMHQYMTINLFGGGAFASASVSGTDASPHPEFEAPAENAVISEIPVEQVQQ